METVFRADAGNEKHRDETANRLLLEKSCPGMALMQPSTGGADGSSVSGLLIPADPTRPVSAVDLIDGSEGSAAILSRLVGGPLEVQAHAEGDIWLNDIGRLIDLPINVRANHWALKKSAASRQGRVGESTMVYGDVVMTGPPNGEGDVTSIDPDLVEYFRSLRLDPSALKDWDVRSVEWTIQAWTDGPDFGLEM